MAQWLGQSQRHFTCLFVCCEKKVRLSEVKLRNLSLVCLRVFASFIGIAGAARTPSVGRRARTRLVVVSLNFRIGSKDVAGLKHNGSEGRLSACRRALPASHLLAFSWRWPSSCTAPVKGLSRRAQTPSQ